eukprot:47799-Hanusia_phi.AAC.1
MDSEQQEASCRYLSALAKGGHGKTADCCRNINKLSRENKYRRGQAVSGSGAESVLLVARR